MGVRLPRIKVQHTVNKSSRRGAKIIGSVVHTTESDDGSLWGIVRYFQKRGAPSSHYVLGTVPQGDGEFVEVVQVVPETWKAWTALSANPVTVNYELVGRARRTRKEWLGPYRAQLRTLAALVADDTFDYRLPVQHALPGVVGHVDLPKYGFPQTHWDPGHGFPWDVFLELVKEYRTFDVRPDPTKVPSKYEGRPKGAPLPMTRWALLLHEWMLTDGGSRGEPRPWHPTPIPKWFWAWRRWKMGMPAHPLPR